MASGTGGLHARLLSVGLARLDITYRVYHGGGRVPRGAAHRSAAML